MIYAPGLFTSDWEPAEQPATVTKRTENQRKRYDREHTRDSDGQLISKRSLIRRAMNEKGAAQNVVGRARYAYGGRNKVAIQGDDMSSDSSGFHVGRFYQLRKVPGDFLTAIKELQSGKISVLSMPVVCVRIEELGKRPNKTFALRSSESKTNNTTTSAIVTEFLPAGLDQQDGCLWYTREQYVQNIAPVPLVSLGAEMRMQHDISAAAFNPTNSRYKCVEVKSGHGGAAVTPLSLSSKDLQGLEDLAGNNKPFLSLKVKDLKANLKGLGVNFADKNSQLELRVKLLQGLAKHAQQQEVQRQRVAEVQ